MDIVPFEEFKKIEIKIGKILSAEKIEGSDKLLKLQVDFGPSAEKRQIIAGIGKRYEPESIIGKECPFMFNLEPKEILGLQSQGMILCADDNGPVLLHPDKEIAPGSKIK
ncbi:MAG: hypothetical protein A3A98_03570 [Candidatus Staskawiczbacteria bacterium RIFCSPLOWO2_01_FULL_40_39]|uniref:Methionine--tRNA ligase n=1 Tax=Candidatus Staskawiczbacteria bacterium RIFCSPHIGHO2_01_FULL_39_25 TaxID=1802202 RepID=A0A1G2HQ93_9BACT|nr:MAG: hypothetical protein A2730_02840 [Candidatus Staskawiczbacteria bacterium RIFCSPHIGHO2_01_FULL_39_25]OGZ72890.1 MAG: hypothetical protein A3A98_03570 [Candidatus Staskawiczbacteria bacterium RIFCSPLOWO2_01_FULL_40_39]